MSTCLNCGSRLSCGCQKKKASDGKSVCNNCASKYETKLRIAQTQTPKKV
jgi:transcription elongation factor Elf1